MELVKGRGNLRASDVGINVAAWQAALGRELERREEFKTVAGKISLVGLAFHAVGKGDWKYRRKMLFDEQRHIEHRLNDEIKIEVREENVHEWNLSVKQGSRLFSSQLLSAKMSDIRFGGAMGDSVVSFTPVIFDGILDQWVELLAVYAFEFCGVDIRNWSSERSASATHPLAREYFERMENAVERSAKEMKKSEEANLQLHGIQR